MHVSMLVASVTRTLAPKAGRSLLGLARLTREETQGTYAADGSRDSCSLCIIALLYMLLIPTQKPLRSII